MAALDLDDTSSYGPEITTIYKMSQGVYYFYVYNYSSSSLDTLSLSGAKIDVYFGNTIYTFYVQRVQEDFGMYLHLIQYQKELFL